MGQQSETGRYPVHFHMCGDVDQRGGYWEPTYVDGLSIHHSFSRCLTIHATNGLLVGLKKKKRNFSLNVQDFTCSMKYDFVLF